jgi:predicted RNA-binding Zn ribbon-like protein
MDIVVDDLPEHELAFHWKGGRVCLDFVATVGERWRRSFERLRTPEDLGRWIAAAGLSRKPPTVSSAQLDAARELREAINRLARPGLASRPGDRRLVNAWAARPAPAPQLTADARKVWKAPLRVEAVLSGVARDAIDLLAGPLAGRIRECAADDCALLFVDASRPGRRRWCATRACGNREHTKAYRRRRREAAT